MTVIDTYGCRNTTTVSISPFTGAPNYTVSPSGGVLTCNTNSIMLTAITNPTTTTAVWTNTTTTSFVVTAFGTFSCVLTNTLSGCTATVPIIITSNTTPPVATNTTPVCNGNTVSLNASSTPSIALGWLAPTIPASQISNPGTSTASGIFTLTATNLTTGCRTQYTVEVLAANLNVANTPATNVLGCVTTSISLLASTSSPSSTITWLNGISTSTVNPQSITSPGIYTVNLSMTSGCSTKSVITITSNKAASVSISVPSTTISCLSGSLALTANGLVGGPYTYTWTPSPIFIGNPYSVSSAGTYTVIGTNAVNGCTATASQTVTKETVNASFVADPLKGPLPLSVSFTNTSVNPFGTTYFWDFGNLSTITTSSMNVSTIYSNAGNFPVVLTATKGFCTATFTTKIIVDAVAIVTIPNVFTPNGDGINDVFLVNTSYVTEINMIIYDRWGLKISETASINPTVWDGRTKGGHIVDDGTYFYVIKATGGDGRTRDYKGTINVFK